MTQNDNLNVRCLVWLELLTNVAEDVIGVGVDGFVEVDVVARGVVL